jgi:hypothetical protein
MPQALSHRMGLCCRDAVLQVICRLIHVQRVHGRILLGTDAVTFKMQVTKSMAGHL